jgi:hypothetical protein
MSHRKLDEPDTPKNPAARNTAANGAQILASHFAAADNRAESRNI